MEWSGVKGEGWGEGRPELELEEDLLPAGERRDERTLHRYRPDQ